MRPCSRSLTKRARTIFEDLGYTVEGVGSRQFRAERAWKSVTVTTVPTDDAGTPTGTGEMRCFVTDGDVDELERSIQSADPEFEYAIIALEGDDYEVVRAPPAGR